jgi:hypothetical protein
MQIVVAQMPLNNEDEDEDEDDDEYEARRNVA